MLSKQELERVVEGKDSPKEFMKRELLRFLEENHRPSAEEHRALERESVVKTQASEARAEESEVRAEKEARLREEQGKEIAELKRQLAAQQERQKAVGGFRAELPTMQTSVLFGTLDSGGPELKRVKEEEEGGLPNEVDQTSGGAGFQRQHK